MSIQSSNAPRDEDFLSHSMSLFYNKTHSLSRYRPLPEKGGFKFMNIPAEIRNMIWELTIEQRLVEIRFADYEVLHNRITHDFVADVPIALNICQGSRNFAMGHYELAFSHRGAYTPVYFNFKLDILYPRASCTKEQLNFLTNNMDQEDCDRVTYLAMYNEHLERTWSLSTWNALPLCFPNLDRLIVLFKSFIDPTMIDAKTLPHSKDSKVWKPFLFDTEYSPTGKRNPVWVQYDRDALKENMRARLQPPVHCCQRDKTQMRHSRRTHFIGGRFMRRDPMHTRC